MSYLSQNLTYLRKNSNYTQDDIAEKVYVSRQAVSKWERGETAPDLETLIALSELYGVSVDGLLKNELAVTAVPRQDAAVREFSELKKLRKKQAAVLMSVWAFFTFGIYALICGIFQVALYDITLNIWLVWFTLPVVPPLILAVRFRREIGKAWIMFFINVPFIAATVYMVMVFQNAEIGAWLVFLIIPLYYAIAVIVCVYYKNQK